MLLKHIILPIANIETFMYVKYRLILVKYAFGEQSKSVDSM